MDLPAPSNLAKRNAKRILTAIGALTSAETALKRAELNLNDAWATANLQGADDWNAMNRLLRSLEIDETDDI